uniref:Poly(rC)-binding protein 3-like n=1 Tax=Sinocyclocheilus grahami TaxID=75366 RepID=A0A672RXL2_SINGR
MEPNKVQSEGGLNVTLTIRLLMHGKEVGSIIKVAKNVSKVTAKTFIVLQKFLFQNSPPKGATIPYRPKPASTPVIFSGGQVRADPLAASAANLSLLLQHQPLSTVPPNPQQLTKLHQLAMQQTPFTPLGQTTPAFPGLDASPPASTHELTIPNDLIGCIIGRQGTKINEIRQMSGAQIKIANAMEGSSERQITITGTPANISLAQYLINARFRDVAAMWNDPSSMTTS